MADVDMADGVEDVQATMTEEIADLRSFTLAVAAACTIGACLLSAHLIRSHLVNFRKPAEQMTIIIIIIMVPLFAVDCLIGLWDITAGEVAVTTLDAIKECYEALVIWAFLKLMYFYLGISADDKVIPDRVKGRKIHLSFPMTLFYPSELILNSKVLVTLENWAMQFVVLRPVLSLVVIGLQLLGWYNGTAKWIVSLMLNVSVSLALYVLVLFYHVFDVELKPRRPLAKFLCVKGVVFFAFWQGVFLQTLVWAGLLHEGHWLYSVEQVEVAVQNFLVCVEMLFFAIAHCHAYDVGPYSKEKPKTVTAESEKTNEESLKKKDRAGVEKEMAEVGLRRRKEDTQEEAEATEMADMGADSKETDDGEKKEN